jgi:hypothetical protein
MMHKRQQIRAALGMARCVKMPIQAKGRLVSVRPLGWPTKSASVDGLRVIQFTKPV